MKVLKKFSVIRKSNGEVVNTCTFYMDHKANLKLTAAYLTALQSSSSWEDSFNLFLDARFSKKEELAKIEKTIVHEFDSLFELKIDKSFDKLNSPKALSVTELFG